MAYIFFIDGVYNHLAREFGNDDIGDVSTPYGELG
jgi:hypothetical protein